MSFSEVCLSADQLTPESSSVGNSEVSGTRWLISAIVIIADVLFVPLRRKGTVQDSISAGNCFPDSDACSEKVSRVPGDSDCRHVAGQCQQKRTSAGI